MVKDSRNVETKNHTGGLSLKNALFVGLGPKCPEEKRTGERRPHKRWGFRGQIADWDNWTRCELEA
jgi:hypothetical protein